MTFTNIIAGGCSFTQDGISGIPPHNNHCGGNSFLDYPDNNIVANIPKTWPGIISRHLAAKSMVNLAASSHGNLLTANSLFTMLTKFNYPKDQTLILFNITEPTRLDIPCEFSHQHQSVNIHWCSDLLPFTYLSHSCSVVKKLKHQMGPDAISYLTSNSLLFLLNFLESKQYTFLFLTMGDYTDDQHLGPILDQYQKNYVTLDQFNNMTDFCVHNQMTVSEIDHHPNIIGHRVIAKKVLDFLKN